MAKTNAIPKTILHLDKHEKEALTDAYSLAHQDVLIVEQPALDRLSIRGADRIDLLERLSTNTFVNQTEGDVVLTALLEANGRLIDLLEVFILTEQLLVNNSPGTSETILSWLKHHIFFQDDVMLDKLDPWPRVFEIIGPHSVQNLKELFGELDQLQPNRFLQNPSGILTPLNWPGVRAYRLLIENDDLARSLLPMEPSAPTTILRAAVEAVRIEAGMPQRDHEIIPGIIPLEVGLGEAISFSKGCYIGQEIIARMDSRGRQATELHGVVLSEPAAPGTPLIQSGKEVGRLTSIAYSPVHAWIGLASIKTRRLDRSLDNLTIQGSSIALQELPFSRA